MAQMVAEYLEFTRSDIDYAIVRAEGPTVVRGLLRASVKHLAGRPESGQCCPLVAHCNGDVPSADGRRSA